MTPTIPTRVFVPSTRQIPKAPGIVGLCHKRAGDLVNADDPLFEIRFEDVDADVLAPVAGTLVRVHVAAGDTVSAGHLLADISSSDDPPIGPPAGPASDYLIKHAALLIAVGVGSIALVWPLFWLLAVLLGSLLAVGVERTAIRGRLEPLDALVLPLRVLASSAGWLRGRLLLASPLAGTVRFGWLLVIALLGTGAVAGLLWLLSHGSQGFLTAVRLGEFGNALRIFAFLVCVSLVRRGLSTPARRALLERELYGLPSAGLAAGAFVAVALAILCAGALARDTWWPASDLRGAVASMPKGLRDTVREWQRSLAETEAQAVVDCAARHGAEGWLPPTGLISPDGTIAVSVDFDGTAPPPDNRSLAVVMLALQNQLAPDVGIVVIHTTKPKARIRYEPVQTNTPITEIGTVADRVAPSPGSEPHLTAIRAASAEDIDVALKCSAVAF